MRKLFIEFEQADTMEKAEGLAPWAFVVCIAEGGYWCFEDVTDYNIWMNQE